MNEFIRRAFSRRRTDNTGEAEECHKAAQDRVSGLLRRVLVVVSAIGLLMVSCAKQDDTDPNSPSASTAGQQRESSAATKPASEDTVTSVGVSQRTESAPAAARTETESPGGQIRPHESLYRFFEPIEGWARSNPRGRSAAAGGGIMAHCEYRRGSDRLVAKVAVGLLGQTSLRTVEAVANGQSNPGLFQRHEVNGLDVILYQDTVTKKNWVLTAVLEESHPAVLEMTFVGIAPSMCLELAEHFNWRAMARAVYAIAPTRPEPGPGMPMGL